MIDVVSDTESTAGEKMSTAQYSPATMLAAGKFKRYIKRPPKTDDSSGGGGGNGAIAAGSRRASQDRRSSRHGGSQDKLSKAGRRCSGGGGHDNNKLAVASRHSSQDKLAASRHGSEDKLSRRPETEATSRLLRLNSLDMGRTNSDSQRRRKGFGILAQTADSSG
jgi:hypothetical protein